jgi:hypothetical protein
VAPRWHAGGSVVAPGGALQNGGGGAAVAPPKNPIKRAVAPGGAYISRTYAAASVLASLPRAPTDSCSDLFR